MKRGLSIILFAVVAAISLASCNKIENQAVYQAIATIKQGVTGECYIEVDAETALIPQGTITLTAPEIRAMVYYTIVESGSGMAGYKTVYKVNVLEVDKILTKWPVESLGSDEADAELYGDDETYVYFDGLFPPTIIEDGYLNVHFAYSASGAVEHYVHLVTNVDGDPYKVEFRHDMNGDIGGTTRQGVVAFPLQELQDTEGKTVKLTLVWNDMTTGKKESRQFDYTSRTDWPVWPDE